MSCEHFIGWLDSICIKVCVRVFARVRIGLKVGQIEWNVKSKDWRRKKSVLEEIKRKNINFN